VAIQSQRDVQLGDRFQRHDRLQEDDQLARAFRLDVEVGTGEAEQDRDLLLEQHHGVHEDAAVGVHQGEDEGDVPVPGPDATDDVGTLVAIEDRAQGLDGVDLP
jgi:hypothetical protein